MDDFSTPGFSNAFGFPPSPYNFIWPFKRPLSSSAPVIVVDDEGKVQFVAGASGGSKITTATAQVLLNVLSFCESVRDAVDRPRIHHQLLPDWISGERDYPQARTTELELIGHYWNYTSSNGVVQAIARWVYAPSHAR
jgi:gamma-glutamyltranspeptidase/glutathione hydrolase/leukotriene-C4 hydrolase